MSPGRLGLGPQPLHQPGIIAVRDEADVLAVGLGGDLQAQFGGDPPHLVLGQIAEREAQEIQLLARRSIEEIALVPARVGALVQLHPAVARRLGAHNGRLPGNRRRARAQTRAGRRTSRPGCSSRRAPACARAHIRRRSGRSRRRGSGFHNRAHNARCRAGRRPASRHRCPDRRSRRRGGATASP